MRIFGYPYAIVMILAAMHFAMVDDAFAENFDFTGQVGYEGRLFTQQPQFDRQFSGLQNSILLKLDLAFETNDGDIQASFIPFLRVDSRDQSRTHWDLREAYLRVTEGDWQVLAGFNSVFWGTTESRHLVNIVNQVDVLEDIDQEDFLGQPMVQVATQQDWGRLEGFLLPGFRGQRFPGNNGRLSSSLPIEDGFSRAELGFVDPGVDVALRYSHFLGDWDLGLSYFHGNSREARLETASDLQSFKPVYDTINQGGLDLQYTTDAWLWKLEGIVREGQGPTFAALVAGFEYTLFQVFETDADIGFLGEYLYDGRDQTRAPTTGFDDDVFLGLRVSLNDVDDTNFLAGAVIDRLTRATALSIEFERRLADSVKFELESRIFTNTNEEGPLTLISHDDFVLGRLSFFF